MTDASYVSYISLFILYNKFMQINISGAVLELLRWPGHHMVLSLFFCLVLLSSYSEQSVSPAIVRDGHLNCIY